MTSTRTASRTAVSAELPALPLTIEGYSVLHQMMRFRWSAWRSLQSSQKAEILDEASDVLTKMEQNVNGQSAMFSLLGHKGDLMFVHFRPSFDELNRTELQLSQLRLSDFLEPTTSYLSVIELGLYDSTIKLYRDLAERGLEAQSEEWKRAVEETLERQREAMKPRLYPEIPQEPLYLFLSHGSAAGRGQELVQHPHRGTRTADERARLDWEALRGRGQADYHRFDRVRRLGVGRRPVRRRSTRV